MKIKLSLLTLIVISFVAQAQTEAQKDSLADVEYKQRQIKIMEQELQIKKDELELKKQDSDLDREKKKIELERAKMQLEEDKRNAEEIKKSREEQKVIEKETKSRRNYKAAIFLEPLPLFVGGFQGGLESKLLNKDNLRLSAGYYYSEDPWYYENCDVMTGMKFDLQYRHYVTSSDPDDDISLYYGGSLVYKFINVHYDTLSTGSFKYQSPTAQGKNINPNVLLGAQALLANTILLDLWAAAGINVPLVDTPRERVSLQIVNPYGQGVILRFGFSIGVPIKN